jgi:Flp pilus assembly protein protease CpaA
MRISTCVLAYHDLTFMRISIYLVAHGCLHSSISHHVHNVPQNTLI